MAFVQDEYSVIICHSWWKCIIHPVGLLKGASFLLLLVGDLGCLGDGIRDKASDALWLLFRSHAATAAGDRRGWLLWRTHTHRCFLNLQTNVTLKCENVEAANSLIRHFNVINNIVPVWCHSLRRPLHHRLFFFGDHLLWILTRYRESKFRIAFLQCNTTLYHKAPGSIES